MALTLDSIIFEEYFNRYSFKAASIRGLMPGFSEGLTISEVIVNGVVLTSIAACTLIVSLTVNFRRNVLEPVNTRSSELYVLPRDACQSAVDIFVVSELSFGEMVRTRQILRFVTCC